MFCIVDGIILLGGIEFAQVSKVYIELVNETKEEHRIMEGEDHYIWKLPEWAVGDVEGDAVYEIDLRRIRLSF